ncbi:MAG: hypothetical protein AABY22_20580 [Nanoarchaeota archaeon]
MTLPKSKYDKDNYKAAYWAGIMDGEGSISIFKHKQNNNYNTFYSNITICNTYKNLCLEAKKFFRTGNIISSKNYGLGKKKVFFYVASNNQAEKILKIVYPWLIIKKSRAKIVLKFQTFLKKNIENVILKEDILNYQILNSL